MMLNIVGGGPQENVEYIQVMTECCKEMMSLIS